MVFGFVDVSKENTLKVLVMYLLLNNWTVNIYSKHDKRALCLFFQTFLPLS